jgi:hypothetical protein
VLGVAVAAWAALPPSPSPQPPAQQLRLTASKHGQLQIRTSRTGRPILTASGLVPGHVAKGQVTVKNVSGEPLRLSLASRHLSETEGPNGGRLSEVLHVQISELTRRSQNSLIRRTSYAGNLGALGRERITSLRPGMRRRYEFSVSIPDHGLPESPAGGDNRYQGAAASVDFVWLAATRR